MSGLYLEQRPKRTDNLTALVADLLRHFHARYHLGAAAVVTERPADVLAAAEKQWLRLSRDLQKRRGFATNPIDILKLTYSIAAMQHLRFSLQTPLYDPQARLFVVKPADIEAAAAGCHTIYLVTSVSTDLLSRSARALMPNSLVVDYCSQVTPYGKLGLRPRAELEVAANQSWNELAEYLEGQTILIDQLCQTGNSEAMDDAVDRLLGCDAAFLARAAVFQRALDLARPLTATSKQERDRYEAAVTLAHRVQTFSSTGFSSRFLNTYSHDDFLLNDRRLYQGDVVAQIERHMAAGRYNLARAYMRLAGAGTPALVRQLAANLA